MSQLRHPHIVQFLGVCYFSESRIPVLLMEKLQTSLDNLLETIPNIPLDIKVDLLTGTGRGVVYLHSHDPPIAHRDLTARNILVDSGLTAKIADLGVARIVNIQPGQLAATMSAGPGNNLYMPPETVQDEGDPRYNTAIDIFSFGVVSLFTITQIFPKDLKPATYIEPATHEFKARSEIERREVYVEQIKTSLGESHSLVKLTVNCLDNEPNDRPTASEVLTQLEEAEAAILQDCNRKSKLELYMQLSDGIAKRESEIRDIQVNYKVQLRQKEKCLSELRVAHSLLKVQLNKTTNKLDQLTNEKNQEIQQLQQKHKQELSEKDDGIAKRENEIQDIQVNYEVQLQQKDESLGKLRVQLDQLACEKKQEVQQLQQKHQQQLSEKDDIIAKMQNEIQDIQANYEVQLQQKDESFGKLRVQLDELACEKKQEVQQLQQKHQQQLSEKDDIIAKMQNEIQDIQANYEVQLQQKDESLGKLRVQLDQLAREKKQEVQQLQLENEQYCSEIDSLRKAIDELRADDKCQQEISVVAVLEESSFDVTPQKNKEGEAEKQEQACGYEDPLSLQQQNMEAQQKEIVQLSDHLGAQKREICFSQQPIQQTPPLCPYVVS